MQAENRNGARTFYSAEVVREFFSAIAARETYDIRHNSYILFGLLWGLPIPILGILMEMHLSHVSGLAISLQDLWHPLHVVLALHPLFFAVVFGALGTIRYRKTARIRDLVERLADEIKQLARANADLKQLDALKDEFLGNVTHELKTPLVTIRGYTDMMKAGRLGDVTDRQARALDVVRRNARRLHEQIDQVLSVSRNRDRLGKLVRHTIPLAGLLRDVQDRHGPAALTKNIVLSIERPDEEYVLWGDRERLLEVFDNLVSNAIKFTDTDGAVTVRFGEQDSERLLAEVVDTGCGIPETSQDIIFDRFRQADGSIRRTYGGSGLGLAIVKGNLEAHGCSVRVESRPGAGARFLFELPLAPEDGTD